MQNTDIEMLIKKAGLTRKADAICAVARESLRIIPSKHSKTTSKLGGAPNWPPGTQWPVTDEGTPLSLVLQLRLSEIPNHARNELPEAGMLYFFHDSSYPHSGTFPMNRTHSSILFNPIEAPYSEAAPHPELASDYLYNPEVVEFATELTFPPLESMEYLKLGLTERQSAMYADLLLELAMSSDYNTFHRAFGHPDGLLGSMQWEAQLIEDSIHRETSDSEWRMLFQISSDPEGSGFFWGACGFLYAWIRRDDLRGRLFERVRVLLEDT